MSPNEKHTKVIQELFDSKVLGTSQNPAKEIQKLKDLVNLQYEYDTGNAPSASQQPKTKQPSASKNSAPSVSQQSKATRRPTSTTTAPSASKASVATHHPASTSGRQSSRDPVQDLFTERARKLETDKKAKEAAEKASRQAKAQAKKEATSLQQAAAISKQAKYASEEKQRKAEEKLAKERVLRNIEADKVERKEREERRKEAARIEADEASRASAFAPPKQAYTTGTMPRSVSSRPGLTSDMRRPGSQVPSRGRSLASQHPTGGDSHGEHFHGGYDEEEYQDDEGYSDEGYSDQGYPDQSYTPRINNNKPSQRRPTPGSRTRGDNLAEQRYASPQPPRSGSSRPFSSQGIRLGGPRGPPVSSLHTPPRSFPVRGPRQRPMSSQRLPPRGGLSTRSSRPQPRRHNVIENFDMHESAKERPNLSPDLHKFCSHPRRAPDNCSHCDRRGLSVNWGGGVCMPCVVKGCGGQWCRDCWDAMVVRKRAMGPRVIRPEGW